MSLVAFGALLVLAGGVAAVLFARRPALADGAFAALIAGGCLLE